MLISTGIIILVGWYRPLESNFANNMMMFTEVVTQCTLYLTMCFTDFVGEPATRSLCGWVCIGTVSFYAAVHITFLVGSVWKSLRHCCRKRHYAKRNELIMEELKMKAILKKD